MQEYTLFVEKLLQNILAIHQEQVVSISGELQNSENSPQPLAEIPFLEELALQIRKNKAFPILEISTANLKKRFFQELPPEAQNLKPKYLEKLFQLTDFFIEISWKGIAQGFPTMPAKLNSIFQNISRSIWQKPLQDGKKMVLLNFPDAELASFINYDNHKLHELYLDAVNIDYEQQEKLGRDYIKKFKNFSKYQLITLDDNLEVEITPSQIELNESKQTQLVIFPKGSIKMNIVADSLNGIFEAEKVYYKNYFYQNAKISFKAGKIQFISFQQESETNYILQTKLKNRSSECAMILGINNGITDFCGYYLYDVVREGNLSLKLYDENKIPILFSNMNVKIKNIKD